MTAILETIHSAHRLALVSGAIAPALQQVMSVVAAQDGAGNPDTETLLEQIQNAMAAADADISGTPVDASPDELAQTYADFRRPRRPPPEDNPCRNRSPANWMKSPTCIGMPSPP